MIKAQIIADSLNQFGNRITTMIVTMPRYILAEFNTHRMLSKNSASSRAIPFKKMMDSVLQNPFIPMAWMRDHTGMQGSDYITDEKTIKELEWLWLQSRSESVERAEQLHHQKLTKQMCNRLLEPYMYHTVIVTGTEWENFFALRCPRYTHEHGENEVFRSKKDYIVHFKGDPTDIESVAIDWLNINKVLLIFT